MASQKERITTSRAFLESTGLVAPPHHDYCFKAGRPVWSAA